MLAEEVVRIRVATTDLKVRIITMDAISASMKRFILLASLFLSVNVGNASAINRHIKLRVDSVYICQSRSAYAYHSHICRGLARCTHGITKVTKAYAIKMGYKPCKICY